jgi:predicted permease
MGDAGAGRDPRIGSGDGVKELGLRRFFQRKQRDDDLRREVEAYLRHEVDDNVARGMTPGAARAAALRKFGNATQVREQIYTMNSVPIIDGVWQDLRYGFRQLTLKPAFALAAVLSLALGIGANAAIFTLVDRVLLRLLPVPHPRELVQLRVDGGRFGSNTGDGEHTFSYRAYQAFRDGNTVFSGLTGERVERAGLSGDDRAELVSVGMVAGNYFQVLGVQPNLGRVLGPEDDRVRNGHPVAVLQYDFWRSRFAGNAAIVGSTIRLNGSLFTVVGVGAADFEGTNTGAATQVWVPVMMKTVITPTWDALYDERYSWFYLLGRLKPGVSIDEGQAAMRVLYRQVQQGELQGDYFQKFPEARAAFLRQSFTLEPAARGQFFIRASFERPLIILQCLVGVVLLIACINVANLLLARSAARQREFAIRGAIGAGRRLLVRQLLMENLVLGVVGGTIGLLLSWWMLKGLIHVLPFVPANFSLEGGPDLRVVVFTAGVTVLTVLCFGLLPAFQGTRVSPGATLGEEGGSTTAGHGHVRLRKVFVAAQVGLSCLLLVGAGLFARSLRNLKSIELGFQSEHVVTFGVRSIMDHGGARKLQLYRSVIEGLAGIPGVKAIGANRERLLTGGRSDGGITMAGVQGKDGHAPSTFFNVITPGYFAALGIPIKAGRDLRWNDWGGSRKMCLVNEAFVKEYLDGGNPVGRLIAQGEKKNPDMEIVGVFGNARYDDVRGPIPRQVFISMDSKIAFTGTMNVYARVQGDVREVMGRLREQVGRIDPNLVVFDMRTLDEQLDIRLANERMLSFLSVAFAILASLLGGVGLYGVLAFVVARRTRELGIRMALGAERSRVVGLVVREMAPVVLAGILGGAAASLLCGRYIESQLFGVDGAYPLVILVSAASICAVSMAAAFFPAWRATRIDPIAALRSE